MNKLNQDPRQVRGRTQRLYLIESVISQGFTERTYIVMGSTGNVYNVMISNKPTCTCPDFTTRFKKCKHIYFILERVMRLQNEIIMKDFYTNAELCNIFNDALEITDNVVIDPLKKKVYDELKQDMLNINKEVDKKDTDDLCPICLDELDNDMELSYCKHKCGRAVHTECFGMWTKVNKALCLFCKSPWNTQVKFINLNI